MYTQKSLNVFEKNSVNHQPVNEDSGKATTQLDSLGGAQGLKLPFREVDMVRLWKSVYKTLVGFTSFDRVTKFSLIGVPHDEE